MLGYFGRPDWQDMSEYVVHFTADTNSGSAESNLRTILAAGQPRPGPNRFGAARSRADAWPVACFDVFVDGSAPGLDGFVPDGAARLVPSFTLRTGWLMPSGRVVEERVGSIIAYVLGARLERYDRAGRQGAYDFQLLVGDEAAALEVTTCVDADLISVGSGADPAG